MLKGDFRFPGLFAVFFVAAALSGCLSSEEQGGANAGTGSGGGGTGKTNNAPIISGAPDEAVLAGDVYSFRPTASDADGDGLSFTASNLPRWASFDTSTGRLSGQTTLGDIGVYEGIQVSVSDGKTTTSLPAFSVTVTDVGLGSMTLNWTPPTENTDGSVLEDLAGYKIYYGKSPRNYTKTIRIDNASISTYVVDNLLPATYYIAATAFNAAGVESSFSNEAIKTVASP